MKHLLARTLHWSECAFLRGKACAENSVSSENTLFFIKLEYWMESFTITFCA
jgi:hypothetical protein